MRLMLHHDEQEGRSDAHADNGVLHFPAEIASDLGELRSRALRRSESVTARSKRADGVRYRLRHTTTMGDREITDRIEETLDRMQSRLDDLSRDLASPLRFPRLDDGDPPRAA